MIRESFPTDGCEKHFLKVQIITSTGEIFKLICHVIICWQVSYRKDMEQEDAAETVKTRGNESSVILTGLEGNTLYHFTVRAYNGAGYGPPSSEVSATTKKSRK